MKQLTFVPEIASRKLFFCSWALCLRTLDFGAMSRLLKSSGAMSIATMFSRVLGMVREMAYAWFMGDGPVAASFLLAFQIPNLFRRLLGEGALTAAFIPIFKKKEIEEGEREMWRAANAIVSALVIFSAGVILILTVVFSLLLVYAGFLSPDARLVLELLRIMFPYMLLVCMAAVCMGMLNSRGYFFIPSLGATMLNVVMIIATLFVAPRSAERLEEQIFTLAWAVLVAGMAQTLFQMPALLREGYRPVWVTPWNNPTVRQVIRKMIPGSIGVATFQLNVLITYWYAYWVQPYIVASFNYAVRLMELPQGVFGLSLATFLLPTLAGYAAEKNYKEFRTSLREGIGFLVFINGLAAVFLLVLAEPIVRLLFERGGEWDGLATHRCAFALACLAPGLIAFSLVNILARAFYALGDTRVPMLISVFCLALNLLLVFWLIGPFKQGGLGIANVITSSLNAGLLFFGLRKKLKFLELKPLVNRLWVMAACMLLAGETAWLVRRFWEDSMGHETLLMKIGAVFVPMAAGTVIYFVAGWIGRVQQAKEIARILVWWRK